MFQVMAHHQHCHHIQHFSVLFEGFMSTFITIGPSPISLGSHFAPRTGSQMQEATQNQLVQEGCYGFWSWKFQDVISVFSFSFYLHFRESFIFLFSLMCQNLKKDFPCHLGTAEISSGVEDGSKVTSCCRSSFLAWNSSVFAQKYNCKNTNSEI